MPYTDYNEVGITADNLEEFIEVLVDFRERKSTVAAQRWLFKLSPEAERHLQMEYQSCGDGYTGRMAQSLVFGEYANQPLPILCPECKEGVMWYRATTSLMKCQACEATDAMYPDRRYL